VIDFEIEWDADDIPHVVAERGPNGERVPVTRDDDD
jgi:hypothetical protein